jgi:Flp pilus assembly protein TadD
MATIDEALAQALQLHNAGRLAEAEKIYLQIVHVAPDHPDALNLLGVAHGQAGRSEQAIAFITKAIEIQPANPGFRSNLGMALMEAGRHDEAVASFRHALQLKPDDAETHYNLGVALMEQGKLDEAVPCYRRALQFKPDHAEVHYNLCMTLGGRLPEEEFSAAEQLLKRTPSAHDQMVLQFGLTHVFDARGEYSRAAELAGKANANHRDLMARHEIAYDPRQCTAYIDQTIAVFSANFFQRVQGWGVDSEMPVFIVGLPRSGTTLLEQILASHPQVFGAGERSFAGDLFRTPPMLAGIDRAAVESMAARYLEQLRPLAPSAARIIDKMPDNYLCLGPLAMLFPRARIIHCRRDVRDVAVSCWMTYFKHLTWTCAADHIVARIHDYQRIMKHWREVLPGRFLEIDYEETVADVEGVARRLVSWCGLEWDPACLTFHQSRRLVRTASVVQVRQPIHARSVGRWKHYERHLEPLIDGGLAS